MTAIGPRQKGSERDIDIALGQRIRARRIKLGMSQTDVADAAQVAYQQIQKYEKGTDRVSVSRLFTIAAALKTTPCHLIGGLRPEQRQRTPPWS